jgi:DNA modification methylase
MIDLRCGDCLDVLRRMRSGTVHCCVTSPPYFGLRDYGVAGQIGLERTPEAYVARLVEVFREVRRVLRDDGTLWLNLGDSYASSGVIGGQGRTGIFANSKLDNKKGRAPSGGLASKQLLGIPWRVAFALQADGWYLRSDIIWHKPNPMPESVRDRPTKGHEYLFLLAKSERYYYDAGAIRERQSETTLNRFRSGQARKGRTRKIITDPRVANMGTPLAIMPDRCRNRRTVWTVSTKPYPEAHFATFPPALIEPCILAGSPVGGIVLDPFSGAGTTGLVAAQHGRSYRGIELNPEYIEMSRRRIKAALAEQVA